MLVFSGPKLVYLANPKTGTTAIEAAFSGYADPHLSDGFKKHVTFRTLVHRKSGLVGAYEFVASVRDPLSALHSWYRYRSRRQIKGRPESTRGMTFAEFFAEWCKPEPKPFAKVNASVYFVADHAGEPYREIRTFRYEDGDRLFTYLSGRLGADVAPTVRNKSPRKHATGLAELRGSIDFEHPKLAAAYALYDKIEFEAGT
jgi:hypothetical protein